MPTFKLSTLGCKVNQYESQLIREQLLSAGLTESNAKSSAEVYIINTCTVTQKADSESLNLIRRAIRENAGAQIFVAGCLTELDAGRIKKLKTGIKIIKNKHKGNIARHILGRNKKYASLLGISYFKGRNRAFLKIQDGCNNRCSYCKVPLVRGLSRSRPVDDIIAEAKRITARGIKEIVLCGICLGAYGRDLKPAVHLVELLCGLEKIKGMERIRLSSIEAGDISDNLIDKIRHSSKICRHLHIPIQSGDDAILKKMGRNYSSNDYLTLINKIKRKVRGIAVTTDVLVGFPGEGKNNFYNTLSLVKRISPLKVHIFPYSAREGTAAADFKHAISRQEINGRTAQLKKLAAECSLEYKKRFLGKKLSVLIEGRHAKDGHFWDGYTDNYIRVLLKSRRNLANRIIPVIINEIMPEYALAEPCAGKRFP